MTEIVQINTKRTPSGKRYYIPVPVEWAEHAIASGASHVTLQEGSPWKDEGSPWLGQNLTVTPIKDEHVTEYRRQRRAQRRRDRYHGRRG
jgi:hypothetical protein